MNIAILKEFLLWCMLINIGLMVMSFLLIMLCKDWAYSIHSKIFKISKEQFHLCCYCFLGLYKVLIFVFNVVPLLALVVIS
jgi:hypothetical protein